MMIKVMMRRAGGSVPGSGFASTILFTFGAERPLPGVQAFIERTGTAPLIDLVRIKLGFPREVFDPVVGPLIAGYAEFVQRLPATAESEQPVNPGALFTRALRLASRALDYRRGQILPRGAAPEVIGAEAHRWTYAVFVAALLHDVLQGGLAVQLLNRFVPPRVLDWLAADPELMRELLAFLSGDDSAPTGAISALVRRAAGQSGGGGLRQRDRGDAIVEEAVPVARPNGMDTDDGGADPATLPAISVATDEAAVLHDEAEYLEDVDDVPPGSAAPPSQMLGRVDAGLASAPDPARRFMGWLQQGLSDGSLRFNESRALVHFVAEGMLLVSPRIFREFAGRFGDDGSGGAAAPAAQDADVGKSIQRQFLRAGWHLRADKGVNILSYQVMRGDRAVSHLSGVVIPNPARFIDPVPPINPVLARLPATPAET